mmetsp:Transcript_6815/g.13992  ORF Transcript_6815/g.13992 Transcript_6815/m.13992 type:complete len:129 (+) Transcript_6815:1835-2221(+)
MRLFSATDDKKTTGPTWYAPVNDSREWLGATKSVHSGWSKKNMESVQDGNSESVSSWEFCFIQSYRWILPDPTTGIADSGFSWTCYNSPCSTLEAAMIIIPSKRSGESKSKTNDYSIALLPCHEEQFR